jgi:hypothetical protein
VPQTKSAEDLRSILRNMTAKSGAEKEKKQTEHQQSLKGVLAEVVTRNQPTQQPSPVAQSVKKSEPPQAKRPFEVPEDALRKVLRGEV